MKRGSGILMHIASLPGPFGIGVFGEEAIAFAKQLRDQGMTYWQVLPFSYPGMGNSPYQSFSAFAGNWLFIDPRRLMLRGLLRPEDVVSSEYSSNKWRIDYDYIRSQREGLLRLAFTRADESLRLEVRDFINENSWVDEVALYLAIKDSNQSRPWWEWDDERLRDYDSSAIAVVRENENYLYHAFVQYLFCTEWAFIKQQINDIGIKIIGDMPIYVSGDSSDVWARRDLFKMNKDKSSDLVFDKVAGVPPDYFCEDGQFWGNPIYDWNVHKSSKYEWWMSRLAENFKIFDMVRIDHFRAFSSYWEIPANAKSAREGEWVEGPGLEFFERVDEVFGDRSRVIAEDLGEMTPDLAEFMRECGLPGMKVMQFAFNPNDDCPYLPHNLPENCVAYTGTHDNNTLLGWLWETSGEERAECLNYCGFEGGNWGEGGTRSASCRAIIRTLWASHAGIVIIPVQDQLGYGGDTRMNTPGTPTGNWMIRFSHEDINSIDNSWYKELNRLYRR